MKVEARIFELLTIFFLVIAVIYGIFTHLDSQGIEWAGLTALVLGAGLLLIIGTYLRFVARRLDTRPEDYDDAEISDGSGDLGFFSPHSWWPVLIAFAGGIFAGAGDDRECGLPFLDLAVPVEGQQSRGEQ